MRLRNVKNKDLILSSSKYFLKNPFYYFGKWDTFFNNNNPIYIEIGMGKGSFLIQNALKNPNINYIGIEKSDSILALASKNIPDNLSNLVIINVDAKEIDKIFSNEVDCLYLNFSDPWPKKRHCDRRLTSSLFLGIYDKIFKKDCLIIQKTDNRNLFEYSIESLSQYGYYFDDVSFDYHNSGYDNIIMTEYEKKFSDKGMPIYRCVAIKRVSNSEK